MFPAPDVGLCPLSLGQPFLPRPRGAEVTVWKVCRIATPGALGSHIQVILGLNGGSMHRQA